MHVRHVLAYSLAVAMLPAGVIAGSVEAPKPDLGCVDFWGQPIPWGPTVKGKRLSLRMALTRLLRGQPVEVILQHVNPERQPPWLVIHWSDPHPNVRAEVSDAAGRKGEVDIRRRYGRWGSSASGVGLRLLPRGWLAQGRHVRPGRYRVCIVVEHPRDRSRPRLWHGTVRSNVIEFEVVDAGPAERARAAPAPLRKWAEQRLAELAAERFETRRDAQADLCSEKHGSRPFAIVPRVERACASSDPEIAARATKVLDRLVSRIVRGQRAPTEPAPHNAVPFRPGTGPTWHEAAPVLGLLGPRALARLPQYCEPHVAHLLVALAASYSPLPPHRTLERPTQADVRAILRDLADQDPVVRLRTVRWLPRTSHPDLLAALTRTLADPYCYHDHGIDMPTAVHPLADEARRALLWQGTPAIGPAIDFCRGRQRGREWHAALTLLGDLGHDPRTVRFFADALRACKPQDRYTVVSALERLGSGAVPLLMDVAGNPKQPPNVRERAVPPLGKHATAEAAGPLLLRLLRDENRSLAATAARAAAELRLARALPDIIAIARNKTINFNHRNVAMRAATELAEPKRAVRLLIELAGPTSQPGVRGAAVRQFAVLRRLDGVPVILDALEDANWVVRARADRTMCDLTAQWTGVGFTYKDFEGRDARAEAAKWRRWWAEHGADVTE